MTDFKRLNSLLICIFVASSFGSTLHGQILGRRIIQRQQPVQGQVIQGQPIQGQIIQGQPIQGQIIQGQPIQGQIIQGQPIPAPVIEGRLIQGQPVPAENAQPAPNAKAIEEAQAQIAELNKRITALTAENARFKPLEGENNKLKESYGTLETEFRRLREAYDQINAKLTKLQNEPMVPAEDNNNEELAAQLKQLTAQYQEAIRQNESMSGQVEGLNKENTQLKNRLSNAGNREGNMQNLQGELDAAAQQLTQFQTKNQTLGQENQRLQGMLQKFGENEEQFNSRITTLTEENQRLQNEYQTATQENESLGGRVEKPKVEKTYRRPNNVDSGLADENLQITKLNAELESENSLLLAEVSELRGQVDKLGQAPKAAAATLPAAVGLPQVAVSSGGKYNVKYWLIPFMLLGLGIGLYTYFHEEYRLIPRGDLAADDDSLRR